MTDLNEFECAMLDTVLESFGVPDTLTREQLLQLFDNDETTAYAMVLDIPLMLTPLRQSKVTPLS